MKRIKKEKDNLKKNNYIGYIFLLIIIIIMLFMCVSVNYIHDPAHLPDRIPGS